MGKSELKAQTRINVSKGSAANPRLEVDLKELFGKTVVSSDLRDEIGQAILDEIKNRTGQGRGLDGKLKKYSKEYIKSLDFKAFGKSPGNVNLTLSGDTLELMDINNTTRSTITIGWDDTELAARAHGHIVGANHLPKRDFFGLPKGAIESIRRRFQKDVDGED